jgi:SAM-dependent MidA family methyltransferase
MLHLVASCLIFQIVDEFDRSETLGISAGAGTLMRDQLRNFQRVNPKFVGICHRLFKEHPALYHLHSTVYKIGYLGMIARTLQ